MGEAEEGDHGDHGGVDLHYKDDGYIELVLKVLARMCDGQHTELQVTTSNGSGRNYIPTCLYQKNRNMKKK